MKIKSLFVLLMLVGYQQAFAAHRINYQISPMGNLIYQLDCMAAVAHFRCSQSDYKALWQQADRQHEADETMLHQWQQLRQQLDQTINLNTAESINFKTSPNFPVHASSRVSLLERIRLVAFETTDPDGYQHALGLWLPQNRVSAEMTVIRHFWPRFHSWFAQQEPDLQRFVKEAEALAEKINLSQILTRMRAFYRADLPADMVLPVNLIAHPKAQARTSGLVFDKSSLIEVLQGEQAAQRLGVVVHEIAHYYHESASIDHHVAVMDHFMDPASKVGKVGYYLFNEAMATVIGNGLVEQKIQKPDQFERFKAHPMSFYFDPGIDAAAKSALDLMASGFYQDLTIDQSFLEQLDQIWSESLANVIKRPANLFRHMGLVIIGDEQLQAAGDQIFPLVGSSSAQMYSFGPDDEVSTDVLKKYSHLDHIVLVSDARHLARLGLQLPTQHNSQAQTAFIQQTPARSVLVVVSGSADFALDTLKTLLAAERMKLEP